MCRSISLEPRLFSSKLNVKGKVPTFRIQYNSVYILSCTHCMFRATTPSASVTPTSYISRLVFNVIAEVNTANYNHQCFVHGVFFRIRYFSRRHHSISNRASPFPFPFPSPPPPFFPHPVSPFPSRPR